MSSRIDIGLLRFMRARTDETHVLNPARAARVNAAPDRPGRSATQSMHVTNRSPCAFRPQLRHVVVSDPTARGHGYATAVTAAVTRDLFDAGVDVFLNVAASNQAAISVYKRLGYHEHCHFWEAHAVLK